MKITIYKIGECRQSLGQYFCIMPRLCLYFYSKHIFIHLLLYHINTHLRCFEIEQNNPQDSEQFININIIWF